jgi:adenylate kinase
VIDSGIEASRRNTAKSVVDEPDAIVELRERIDTMIDNLVDDVPSESVKLFMALVAKKLGEDEAAAIIIDTHGLSKFGLKR